MRFLTLLLVFYTSLVHSQTDTVYLFNKNTNQPVKNAMQITEITADGSLLDTGFEGFSNQSGIILLENIKPESWIQIGGNLNEDFHTQRLSIHQIRANKGRIELIPRLIQLGVAVEVIGYSGFKEKMKEIPSKISIIDKKDIRLYNPQHSADALQNTGEVFIQKSQMGGGSPIIRGFEANKVLLVVDGVRMNNAIYRSGHLQNVVTIDKDIIERVEILHGPSAVMYGSDALGGVMSFTTQKPLLRYKDNPKKYNLNGYVRFSTANFERTGHIDFNIGGETFASLSSLTYSDFSDLRAGRIKSDTNMARYWNRYFYVEYDPVDSVDVVRTNENPNVQVGTAYSQLDIVQKFRFRPSNQVDFLLNLQQSISSKIPRYDQLTDGKFTFSPNQIPSQRFRFAEWYYGPQNRFMASFHTRIQNDSGKLFSNANIIVAFQKIDEDRISRRFRDNLETSQTEDVFLLTLNADFVKKFRDKKLLYGLEATHNIVHSDVSTRNILIDSISLRNTGTRYPDGGSTMSTVAAYGSQRWKVNDRVHILLGIRYTFTYLQAKYIDTVLYQLPFDKIQIPSHSLTGSMALAWDLQRQWQFKGLFSTSLRPPNIDDIAKIRAKGNMITVPNDQIKPERALNFEISMGKTFSKQVRISGTAFYTYLLDAITQKKFLLNRTDSLYYDGAFREIHAKVNSRRAYIWGLSGNLEIEFSESAFLKGLINFTQGRELEENKTPLAHIPPLYGQLEFAYKRQHFDFSLITRFNAAKKLASYSNESSENLDKALVADLSGNPLEIPIPAWFTINIYTSYKVNKKFTLHLAVENLLDWHYRTYASGVSAAGQNIILALRGHF